MGAGQPRGCATLDRGCKQRPGALGQLRQQPRLSFMPSEFPRMEFGGNSPHCIKTGTLEGNGWQRRLATCTLGGGSPSGPARSVLLLLALDAARNEVRILMQVGVLGISHGAIRTWGDRSPRSPVRAAGHPSARRSCRPPGGRSPPRRCRGLRAKFLSSCASQPCRPRRRRA